jgi:hypothetical protein
MNGRIDYIDFEDLLTIATKTQKIYLITAKICIMATGWIKEIRLNFNGHI